MVSRTGLLLAAFALMASAAPLLAASTERLKNDKVLVVEDKLAPVEPESIDGNRPSVLVYFSGQKADLAFADGTNQQQSIERGKNGG